MNGTFTTRRRRNGRVWLRIDPEAGDLLDIEMPAEIAQQLGCNLVLAGADPRTDEVTCRRAPQRGRQA